MSDDTRRSELALLTLTERQQHHAAVSVAAYADRQYPHPSSDPHAVTREACDLTADLIDELGLNGRPMRTHRNKNTPWSG